MEREIRKIIYFCNNLNCRENFQKKNTYCKFNKTQVPLK